MYYPHLREIHLDPWLLKRKNRQLLIQTIAHETYHHYQYERGVFTWLSGPEYYKGLPVEKIEMTVPHSKRPWERAANRYGNKILKMYNNGELKWLKTRKTVSGA
jgi:predicted SprT family Zn-dependent metalloprotease